jgi:hypothetical protein
MLASGDSPETQDRAFKMIDERFGSVPSISL